MTVTTPSLSISPEKVCFFVVKAREFDVKDVVTDPDSGSIRPTMRCLRYWKIIPMIQPIRS